tara:strand:- start:208 stop:393 length:186 start_codon:yes stop_codon:yes gene_type:complete
MSTQWDKTSWQKEFLEMKSHSLSDIKLLTEGLKGLQGLKGLTGAWRLGVLHVEYERLKKQR